MTKANPLSFWQHCSLKLSRLLKACAFLSGKGCACAGQGIIHELEVAQRQQKQASQEGSDPTEPQCKEETEQRSQSKA